MSSLIELCQLYINNPCEEREQAIKDFLSDQWIPVKYRQMTAEELSHFDTEYTVPHCDAKMFDCPLPEDDQEIWTCYETGLVEEDICSIDDDEYYGSLYGLEENGDWEGVVAWMPRNQPKPYKGECYV